MSSCLFWECGSHSEGAPKRRTTVGARGYTSSLGPSLEISPTTPHQDTTDELAHRSLDQIIQIGMPLAGTPECPEC
jgi:hypothetical protein